MTKEEMNKDEWYVILNMNCKYEICRMCPKSGLFKGSYEECENWIKQKKKEEIKDEMKDRISMALKDPVLQQGFEIICKENAELKNQLFTLRNERNTFLAQNEQYEKDLIDFNENLTKAKEIIKKLKALYLYPVITKDDVKRQDEILAEAEQFLKEVSE